MLESPPTIRVPRPEEFPKNSVVFERFKKREKAKILEGYLLLPNTTDNLPFKFHAKININNSRLWELFISLTNLLPNEVSCIYKLFEEKDLFSPNLYKSDILNFLERFKIELTQDCNLEFGLIYKTEDELEEVFVSESKYFKIWSNEETIFRNIMKEFSLKEIPDLNFIDEFPKVVEPLTMHNIDAKETDIVIDELNKYFKMESHF
jgi:hypothetical protein